MRRLAVTIAIVLFLAGRAAAGEVQAWRWTHVRWGSESARTLLVEAAARSALVRGMLDDLERTDVIVFVTVARSAGDAGAVAHLSFAAAAGKVRYLRVEIDTFRAGAEWDVIPLLGHELQHAREVAGAPEVRDVKSFERLYYRIGWQSGRHAFETAQARSTGRRIQAEMRWAKAAPAGAGRE